MIEAKSGPFGALSFSMHAQLPLSLEDTTPSHLEARERGRAEDAKASHIRGLQGCIEQFAEALRLNTYPVCGRGEVLDPEHRPYYERQIVKWKAELEQLTR